MLVLFGFLAGLALGSFLNVCIVRLPAGESIVRPGSHCRACRAPVAPWDNIPVLSFVLLRGRCRACGARISSRYPLVELLTGALVAALTRRFGLEPTLILYTAFAGALVVVAFIDLDHQIIPDAISVPGTAVGLAGGLLGHGRPPLDCAAGAVLGFALLYAVAAAYHALTGKEGMGGGDIKLMAMIGAFLGWTGVLITLLAGSLAGSVAGGISIYARGGDSSQPIPFGPFLALGALGALFFGDSIVAWYWRVAFPA